MSQKDLILAAITKANQRGLTPLHTWEALEAFLPGRGDPRWIDPHNGIHLLHSLQTDGLITMFKRENRMNKASKMGLVTDIDLSAQGRRRMTENLKPRYEVMPRDEALKAVFAEQLIGNDKSISLGKTGRGDATDYRNLPTKAPGGPIERIVVRRVDPEVATGAKTRPAPRQNEQPVTEEAVRWSRDDFQAAAEAMDRALQPMKEEAVASAELAEREVVQTRKPSPQEAAAAAITNERLARTLAASLPQVNVRALLGEFPLISKLFTREEKVIEAARLLEEAGLVEQATSLMDIRFEPLEQEVVNFLRKLDIK